MRIRRIPLLAGMVLLAACQQDGTAPVVPESARTSGVEGFPTPGESRTGYILGLDGKPMRVTFAVHEGRAIFEGDIDLGPAASIARSPEELLRPDGPRYGVVRAASSYRWANGVVPYVIDPALPDQWRVTNAIAHIEANTSSVDFVPRSGQADYVYITTSSGCSSSVGRVGGVQYVWLASGCSTGNTIHELAHALGMFHEQSRCDRETFVEILWGNIQSGYEHNFSAQCTGAVDVGSYNEGSIMHYPPDAFTRNGLPTIRSRRGLEYQMGQRSGLASTDIQTIDWMYPPPPPPSPLSVYISGRNHVSQKGTYTWEAFPSGGSGSYGYQWEITWINSGYRVTGSSQKTQTVVVSPYEGDVELKVTVTSGGETATDTHYVSTGSSIELADR